jgi:cystathionine beta-lyase family protein involved in aluminum resistance
MLVAEGLDLYVAAKIFKDSENLEEYEKALNDPAIGINNLDLDEDGYIDYIRIVEQVVDDTYMIMLQVPLGQNEFQDVATIEIEKTGNENYRW